MLPEEFRGLLDREKRVIDIEIPDVGLVKDVIEGVLAASDPEEVDIPNGAGGSV